MITKADILFIRSLSKRAIREQEQLFVVEGEKMAVELISSGFNIRRCFVADGLSSDLKDRVLSKCSPELVGESVMGRISSLKSPSSVLMLVEQSERSFELSKTKGSTILALDGVQDPGNLGTIVRLADWFGISTIVCSEDTVDIYNQKVIQSTMGAILRVGVYYADLKALLSSCKGEGKRIYGTFLEGRNLYSRPLEEGSVILFGSEGSGISGELEALVDEKITIPSFGTGQCESLNVAVAAAIVCSELKRG